MRVLSAVRLLGSDVATVDGRLAGVNVNARTRPIFAECGNRILQEAKEESDNDYRRDRRFCAIDYICHMYDRGEVCCDGVALSDAWHMAHSDLDKASSKIDPAWLDGLAQLSGASLVAAIWDVFPGATDYRIEQRNSGVFD